MGARCDRCGGTKQAVRDEDGFHRTRCLSCGKQFYDNTKYPDRCDYCGCRGGCKLHTRHGKAGIVISEWCPECGPKALVVYRGGYPGI